MSHDYYTIAILSSSDPPVQDGHLLSSPSTNPSLSRSKPCIGCPGAPPLRWGFAKGCLFVIYIQITSIVFKALIKAICSFWNCSLFPFGRSGWVSFASLLKLSMFSSYTRVRTLTWTKEGEQWGYNIKSRSGWVSFASLLKLSDIRFTTWWVIIKFVWWYGCVKLGWVSFASLLKLSMFSIRYKSHHKVSWVMLWMDQVLNLAVTSSRVRISSLGMPRISRSPGSIKTSPLS